MNAGGGLDGLINVPGATLVFNFAILAAVAMVGFYVVGKLRSQYRQSDVPTSQLLDNFRTLHSRGQLSNEEYRNIKAKLASQIRDELERAEEAD